MCGIAGFYHLGGAPASPHAILRMIAAQRHRGPDDWGAVLFSLRSGQQTALGRETPSTPPPGLEGALGFARLSILDLSAAGHQPMWTRGGRLGIAFNGEIYNAFDHRARLEAEGVAFHSRTDTEVILALHERYGWDGMLERIEGMFTICLVDLDAREIRIARDPFGIKPLYWAETDGTVLFASEAKAFLQFPGFRPELDEARLDEFLSFRYCAAPRHLLRGVRQLEPGCYLRVRPEGVASVRYYSLPDAAPDPDLTPARSVDLLEQHLSRSVRMQLLSDVPVGCQLSGGIDSSVVTLFAAGERGAVTESFSILLDDPSLNEQRWVDQVARQTGVQKNQYLLDANGFFDRLPAAVRHLDEPLAHVNSVGIYRLTEGARARVKVLLSGEGADELLGGYTRFLYLHAHAGIAAALPLVRLVPRGFARRMARKFATLGSDPVGWFVSQTAAHPAHVLRIRRDAHPEAGQEERRALFERTSGSLLDRSLAYELSTYLVNLLVRQDKMTMAHSVENRVPFLDRALVAAVRTMPSAALVQARLHLRGIRAHGTKLALKRLAARHFGRSFAYRGKIGFALPLRAYLSTPRFDRMMVDEVLPGVRRRGLIDANALERMWRALARPSAPDSAEFVWSAVAFELWAQAVLDAPAARDGALPDGLFAQATA